MGPTKTSDSWTPAELVEWLNAKQNAPGDYLSDPDIPREEKLRRFLNTGLDESCDPQSVAFNASWTAGIAAQQARREREAAVGEAVQLRAIDGPLMVVMGASGADVRTVLCGWFDLGQRFREKWFPVDLIERWVAPEAPAERDND